MVSSGGGAGPRFAGPVADDEHLARLTPVPGDGAVVVDLGPLAQVEPVVLVGAAALAQRASAQGRPFRLLRPEHADGAEHAARMRLGRVIADLGGDSDLPAVDGDEVGGLLAVTGFRSSADVRRLAELAHSRAEELGAGVAAALHKSVSEIGGNVLEHADPPGYLAAQFRSGGEAITFAVADAGPGLLGTLRSLGASTDRDALAMALSGVSRLPDADRGRGLPTTLALVSRFGGSIYLASGTAAVTATMNARWHTLSRSAFPGTLVQGYLRTVYETQRQVHTGRANQAAEEVSRD